MTRRKAIEAAVEPDQPYFIEVDTNGCDKCGHDRTWCIVGPDPDEQATSASYGDEDEAQHICDALNDAYYRGFTACIERRAELDRRTKAHERLAAKLRKGER